MIGKMNEIKDSKIFELANSTNREDNILACVLAYRAWGIEKCKEKLGYYTNSSNLDILYQYCPYLTDGFIVRFGPEQNLYRSGKFFCCVYDDTYDSYRNMRNGDCIINMEE